MYLSYIDRFLQALVRVKAAETTTHIPMLLTRNKESLSLEMSAMAVSVGFLTMTFSICHEGYAAPRIEMDRRKAVVNLPLTITCISEVTINTTVSFSKRSTNEPKGGCLSSGTCQSGISRYSLTQNKAQGTTTLTISSVNSTADTGTWFCQQEGEGDSGDLNITQTATVLDWTSVIFTPSLSSLPSVVTPQKTVTVTITTPCAAPKAFFNWRYQQGVSGSPQSSTSTSQTSCPSGQVQTINTLSLPGNTPSLFNRNISLNVYVEHDSFDPPSYTRSANSRSIQFPVPVTSITMQEISSDNEKVGWRLGTELTLTCVTSASLPASTVSWSGLPSGTTPTSTSTSGLLKTTTSSVTFNLSKSDQGRAVQCTASNIEGQTSPQSNRAVLEVQYGPDDNQVRLTKTPDVVAVEGRNVILTCATLTSVSPGVTFTFTYSDGSPVSGGVPGSVAGSAGNTWSQSLTFQPIRDKRTIQCTVRNTATGVQESQIIVLEVKWKPSGLPSIQDFTSPMFSGEQQTIRCTVTGGNPLADITWSCSNSDNNGRNSTSGNTATSTLTFWVAKQQDGRQCSCRATWMYGGYIELDFETFIVYYPPDAPTLSDPGTLCEGKSTTLSCSSSDLGKPAAKFYWTQNNAEVHNGSMYTFTPGKYDNEVLMRCAAGNAHTDRAGHIRPQSGARQLNVFYKPQVSISGSETRKEGQSLSLLCSADSNPGNPVLSWQFGGQSWTTFAVEKTNLSRFDDGVYTCVGRVSTGDVCPGGSLQGQKSVSVIVNYAPDISSTDLNATEGQRLTLRCAARGRPNSYTFRSFTQYWGDTAVDTRTGSQSGGTYTWSTDDASYLDTGVYECSVDNGVTDRQGVLVQRKRVSVHVRAAPKFTEDFPTLQASEVGSTVTISQSVYTSGLMYTSVNWTFGGQTVKNQSVSSVKVTLRKSDQTAMFDGYVTSATFTFHDGDIGVYTVHVCNFIGCSDYDVNLTAAGPPGKPLNFRALSNATQTSVWLSWLPNFPGGPYTQRFHVEYQKSGEEWKELPPMDESTDPVNKTMVLEVKKLSPGTVYEFRGFAVNTRTIRNKSEYTDIVRAETDKAEDNPTSGLVIGAAVGCTCGVGTIIVVVVIFIKRRSRKDDGTEEALHENRRGTDGRAEMVDNCLYARSEDVQERPVMQENDLYAGSGDIGTAAGKKSTQKDAVSDVYAMPVMKKDRKPDNKVAKKKDKKKIKKDEKIPLKTQNRGDVYENTVPGQFGAGASADYDANTYANAAFVNDEATGGPAAVENPEPPTGRDANGCLYVGIDFGNQKPGKVIIGDEKSPYADIAFGRVGPPPATDEDEEEKKKKDTASK